MLATIFLPPGTERVTIGEIPQLIAEALHPLPPEGTPRVLLYVLKAATRPELAAEWCGIGNNFPVSLTDADWDALYAGPWCSLPRLPLQPASPDGPRKFAPPVPEPEWAPYQLAFDAAPPTGWKLEQLWLDLDTQQRIRQNQTQEEYARLLEKRVVSGALAAHSPTSHLTHGATPGRQLRHWFLTVAELTDFAREFLFSVQVRREFERTALASELLAQLREEPADELVQVRSRVGSYSGTAVAKVRDFVEQLTADAERQSGGYFTVGEAAQMLADANPGVDAKALIERMASACVGNVQTRRRLIRGADLMPLDEGKEFREFMDLVHIEEVDEWLSRSMGVPYRLGPLLPALSVFPGGKHLPTDVHYTIPLHPPLEPRGPWKGGRMADDDVLSLAEAARQASRHAGQEVTDHDFLRAAARGEIRIRAIMHKTATMLPVRAAEGPITLQAGRFQELSPETCELLSITGKAGWRGVEAFEPVEAFDGRVCRFTRWRLPVGEPDILTGISDCIVMGTDVRALADAFLHGPSQLEWDAGPKEQPDAPKSVEVAKKPGSSEQLVAPVFSMPRAALIAAHEHHWPTIRRDLQDASANGLKAAKAGAREWYEQVALEWARAKGKLTDNQPAASDGIDQAMRNMAATLPTKKHRLEG
jgi:hypothetical protein